MTVALTACPTTVERGLPACDAAPIDDLGDVDCERLPALCHLPVESEPDPGGDPIDLVFVAAGGLRRGDLGRVVAQLMANRRADPASIIGRDPTLFRVHVVDVAPPPLWGDDPLPACVDRGSRIVSVSLERAALAARNAPAVDAVVVMTPEVGFDLRESAAGSVALVALGGDPLVFEHELGHALIGLGDEYVELEACCDQATSPPGEVLVVGDEALTWWPNLSADERAPSWQGLANAEEGGARCARCVFRPAAPCLMHTHEVGGYCPVCERAIEARLHRHAPDRHDDRLPSLCALAVEGAAAPARGDDVSGVARGTLVDEPVELSLVVDGAAQHIDTGLGMAAFAVPGAATRGATTAELVLRCARGADAVERRLAFR